MVCCQVSICNWQRWGAVSSDETDRGRRIIHVRSVNSACHMPRDPNKATVSTACINRSAQWNIDNVTAVYYIIITYLSTGATHWRTARTWAALVCRRLPLPAPQTSRGCAVNMGCVWQLGLYVDEWLHGNKDYCSINEKFTVFKIKLEWKNASEAMHSDIQQ